MGIIIYINIIMSSVSDYVGIMRQNGNKVADNNPNSELSQLKTELVAHYKSNPVKANELIKSVESGIAGTMTANMSMHYNAAVIAVRGYTPPAISNRLGPDISNTKQNDLDKLKAQGWRPLNEVKEPILLVEG